MVFRAILKEIADRRCTPMISDFFTGFNSSHNRHVDVKENYIVVIRWQTLDLLQDCKSVDCLVNLSKIFPKKYRTVSKLESVIVGNQAAMYLLGRFWGQFSLD